jgi:hypothetical protein
VTNPDPSGGDGRSAAGTPGRRATVLDELAATLREEGGLIADLVADPGDAPAPHGDAAGEHALVVEAVREGYLQHYGEGRVVRSDHDPDLALLAGDRLYAFGLARLAERGALGAVAELADLISLCAQSHAEGDPERAAEVWEAGAAAVGHGTTPEHEAAKATWRGAQ